MVASTAIRPSSTAKPAQSTPELMWNATCAVPPLELAAIAASAKQTKTPNPNQSARAYHWRNNTKAMASNPSHTFRSAMM